MGANAPAYAMRSLHHEIVDLTADDEDEDVQIILEPSNPRLLAPAVTPKPEKPLPSPPRLSLQDRPTKRRKIEGEALPEQAALEKCLELQVFPHLDHATEKLDNNIYDVKRLGAAVIRHIVDTAFERHFRGGNGKIPGDVEALVAVRIQRRVLELTAGPEFRRHSHSTPLPVLPSIEDDGDDEDNGDDGDDYDGDNDDHDDHDDDHDKLESPKRRPKAHTPPITPQRLRARAKATKWQSGKAYESRKEATPLATRSQWFDLPSRPYLRTDVRQSIISGSQKKGLFLASTELLRPDVFHVDFTPSEIKYLRYVARAAYGRPIKKTQRTVLHDLRHLLKKVGDLKTRLAAVHSQKYTGYDRPPRSLLRRTATDITNFLDDLYYKKLSSDTRSLFLEREDIVSRSDIFRANRVPALLLTREIAGNHIGLTRRYQNFTTAFKSNKEDYLEPKVEWTNCAGDLMAMSWLSNTHFICGTTTHSDSHNQQYNKPGNLLLGSATSNTLQAYPDHRIVRPIVSHGDNALESMRESQDPWLYTSVVSSDYEPSTGLAFTSSFDKTVKIWKLDGDSITNVGTWEHGGRVNFVIASKNRTGTITTAADVPTEAVRVYHLDTSDVSGSQYDSYSCTRVHDEDYMPSEKWAYFPAAIRWGLAPEVQHLLLIGYSPRSIGGEDHEIPEDKLATGELCLWNTVTRTQVKVNSAKTQNVFEVAWHPSRGSFAAATSASQTLEKVEDQPRTQIRIFEPNPETGQYGAIKTLDCAAVDINELSIRPNSTLYSYVTASCTDGKVYVWDTAATDHPMCVLEHGDPVEELLGDREQEDVGVKFTAWGTTADRLYTGSSDGVVKVWNIRHGKGVHVKDLIEVAAPITVGAFSPDFTKLVIGDGSGRVYLMALEEDEGGDQSKSTAVSSGFLNLQLNGKQRAIRRPRPFIPHAEPPLPEDPSSSGPRLATGQTRAREYLKNSELARHTDATIGVIQGENYSRTGLFRAEAHLDGDVNGPLLSGFENQQQCNQNFSRAQRFPRQRRVSSEDEGEEKLQAFRVFHGRNGNLDFSKGSLDTTTRLKLEAEGAELEISPADLDYESSVEGGEGGKEDRPNGTCNLQ
ncbi:hypothetical protein F5X99DRAFT_364794 [Biscogniauxia marginata]|nr:hypothetical protein F5X99DRAFT_364794 [Biscogniauxia marginata]